MFDTLAVSVLPALFGYALGSIPFGYLLTRLAGRGDIRTVGSGNIGATNVLRAGHKGLAALTLLLDGIKGTLAVVIGAMASGSLDTDAGLIAGLGAFLGHIFPVWLSFRGGKGVATYIGVISGLAWQVALVFAAVWIAVAAAFRYSSLAALAAAAATPFALFAFGWPRAALFALVMTALLVWKHAANIDRLSKGVEPKIGSRS